MEWHVANQPQPHEANLLYLDSAKARSMLGWRPVWNLDTTLEKPAQWYEAWMYNKKVISRQQFEAYVEAASNSNIEWAKS